MRAADIVSTVRSIAEMVVGADEVKTVKAVEGATFLMVEIHPASDRAAGHLIGRDGQTVDAIRHLVMRGGRALAEPIRVDVVVVSVPRARG